MTWRTWTVLFVLACSSGVSAQPRVEPPSAAPGDRLKVPVGVWIAGVAADQATTYWFSSRYGDLMHEENPLVRPLDRHPILLVATGAAVDAATGWAALRLLGPRHPKLARAVFYGAAGYRAYLAAHNVQMMRIASGMRSAALAPQPIR